MASGSIFETLPENISSLKALTLMDTSCPTVTFPISISSTKALILTFDRSAILIKTVPPPTAEVGDFVKKGTILARIDQRTPKNVLDQAEADLKLAEVRLENAEAQLVRGEALHAEGSIADKNFEEIQEGFASAKSQHVRSIVNVENAKIALDDTLVKSPLDATIISRPVEVGQVISSSRAC